MSVFESRSNPVLSSNILSSRGSKNHSGESFRMNSRFLYTGFSWDRNYWHTKKKKNNNYDHNRDFFAWIITSAGIEDFQHSLTMRKKHSEKWVHKLFCPCYSLLCSPGDTLFSSTYLRDVVFKQGRYFSSHGSIAWLNSSKEKCNLLV